MGQELDLGNYSEIKPHAFKQKVWNLINIVFVYLPYRIRFSLLRLFGAKIHNTDAIWRAKFYAPWNFQCGDHVCIAPGVEIYCKDKVVVGRQVTISQGAYLCTASHDISSPYFDLVTAPITVGDNVWIAAKATILPGVTIGEGAVVGCGAVVAKDVPPWTIVVGNPAKVVGSRRLRDV